MAGFVQPVQIVQMVIAKMDSAQVMPQNQLLKMNKNINLIASYYVKLIMWMEIA